ncbi:MAG: biopolymer transporter ExbD [Pseudomonadota bacterium]
MRLSAPEPRRRALSLTPLIDVVFLLLVFFMLASTFIRFSTVKLETAGAGTGSADRSKLALIHVGKDALIHINGQPVSAGQLPDDLAALIAEGKTEAVVVVRKQAEVGDLVTGLSQVRAAGFNSVRVVD